MNHAILPIVATLFAMAYGVIAGAQRFDRKNHPWLVGLANSTLLVKAVFVALSVVFLTEVWLYQRATDLVLFDAEASSLIVSVLYGQGLPLYHAPDSPLQYGLLYGPLYFLIYHLGFLLTPGTLLGPKLLAALFLAVSLAGIGRLIVSGFREGDARWLAGVFVLMLLMLFGRSVFTARGDVVMLALATLTALVFERGRIGLVVLALAMGVSVNIKATAVLYFLPPIAMLLWRSLRDKRSLASIATDAMLVSVLFAGTLAAPFALDGVVAKDYLWWLAESGKHRFEIERMVKSCYSVFVFMAAPGLALYWLRSPSRDLAVSGAALFLAGLVAATLGGKVGAGPYHLLPLIPFYVMWLGRMNSQPSRRSLPGDVHAAARATFAFCGLVAIFLFTLNTSHVRTILVGGDYKIPVAAIDEVNQVVDQTGREVAMGLGALASRQVNLGLNVVMRGGRFLLTDASIWDTDAGGFALPDSVASFVSRCEIERFLVPKGDVPFRNESIYYPDKLVAEAVSEAFVAAYELERSLEWFDLWRCRRS